MPRQARCCDCPWTYTEHPSRPAVTAVRAADKHWADTRHSSLIRGVAPAGQTDGGQLDLDDRDEQ